jgi:hypothetical protein
MDRKEFEEGLKKAIEPLRKFASKAMPGFDEASLDSAWPLFAEFIRLTTGLALPPDKEAALDLVRMASPSVEKLCEAMARAASRLRAREGGAKPAALWERARELIAKLGL